VVLYIGGSGRSGSTVVERVLGAVPGYVNVGETVELFRGVLRKSFAGRPERCGCGRPLLECPYWTAVGERAFGGWTQDLADEAADLQRRVASQRQLPRLLLDDRAGAGFRAELARLREIYAGLYRAVLAESAADVVVDASKWPGQAMALAGTPDLDVRVLHLVRDVRGVASSWSKAGVVRPNSGERRETMKTHAMWRTAPRWSLFQLEMRAVAARADAGALVRYEDVVRRPEPVLRSALERLGLPVPPGAFAHVEGQVVTLVPSHGLAGNPSRATNGPVTLRADEAWRTSLSRGQQTVLAALGLPGLAACGYLRVSRGG
jgi:hypothetical protein